MIFVWILLAMVFITTTLALMTKGPSLTAYDSPPHEATYPRAEPSQGYAAVEQLLYDNFTKPAVSGTGDTNSLRAKRERFEGFGEGRDFETEFKVTQTQVSASANDLTVDGEWTMPEGGNPDARILYIHGGAFAVGSAKSHRPITAQLASRTGCAVFAPNYRLIPENKRMDGIEDCRAVYDWVLENGPNGATPAQALYVGGDSAGGNLTLSVIAWARDTDRKAPNAVFAFSPTVDTTMSAPSIVTNFDTDIMLKPLFAPLRKLPKFLLRLAMWSQAKINPKAPIISPVYGDLSSLPPMLIQASEAEMLHDDSVRYVRKAVASGTSATLQTWQHVPHVWQIFDQHLEESDEAFAEIAKFIKINS